MKKTGRIIVFLTLFALVMTNLSVNVFALSKSDNSLLWPVDHAATKYWISALDVYSGSGNAHGSSGQGIDIYGADKNGQGTVYAIADGTVTTKNDTCTHVNKSTDTCGGRYGNYIKIKHSDGSYSLYAHLEKDSLTSKTNVKAGEAIGRIGSSGSSSGYHLHFEIFTSNNKKDYAFDYYINNPLCQKKFLFKDGLQKYSKKYGNWIKENYQTKSGSYWSYSGSNNENTKIVSPAAPTGLKAVKAGEKTATISWNAVSGATSYEVQYYSQSGASWKTDPDYKPKTATSYVSTGLGLYNSYKYRVRAVNSAGTSPWAEITYNKPAASAAPSVKTPSAPTGLKAVKAGVKTATISWNAVSGATSYEVQYYSQSGASWKTDPDYKPKTATSYVSTGLGLYNSYRYRVRAVNSAGVSGWTEITYKK